MTKTKTKNGFQTVLAEFASAFETAKRDGDDSKTYTRRKKDAPEWVNTDVIRTIHESLDDRLPNDWVYEATAAVAESLDDYGPEDADAARDKVHEIADGLVDVYNSDRLKWLADHLGNAALVDEACSELGGNGNDKDTFDRIGLGQFMAYERIAGAVIEAVEDEAAMRTCDECGGTRTAEDTHRGCDEASAARGGTQ